MNSKKLLKNYLKRRNEEDDEDELDEFIITKCMRIAALVALDFEERAPKAGSVFGHTTIDRDYLAGYEKLMTDYFSGEGSEHEDKFRHNFRMSKCLFLRINEALEKHNQYFMQKKNAAGKLGLHSLQKTTAAMQILSTGIPAIALEEDMKMSESTILESLRHFCRGVCEVFGEEYLRAPTLADIERLYEEGEKRGFPGMLGSLDCMNWTWKHLPTNYHGPNKAKDKMPNMILEAVASYDLWIWHCFFGLPGTPNDISVLDRSPVFRSYTDETSHNKPFDINDNRYTMGYYLADGIYPSHSNLVSAPEQAITAEEKYFCTQQEDCIKDVERAFGMLQSRFAILSHPGRLCRVSNCTEVMRACVIMHNMIVEDERGVSGLENLSPYRPEDIATISRDTGVDAFNAFFERRREIRDTDSSLQLRQDLINHHWNLKSNK